MRVWQDGPDGGTPIDAESLNDLERRTVILIFASGAYPARPSGAISVLYIGPSVPTDWEPNDRWMDNS